MSGGDLEIERTPRFGYTDYAVGWLFGHLVLLPAAAILASEPGGLGFAALFAAGFLAAPAWPGGIVRRALAASPFYRGWLAVATLAVLLVTAPGTTGNLPSETFHSWLLSILIVAGIVLIAGWYRGLRQRL